MWRDWLAQGRKAHESLWLDTVVPPQLIDEGVGRLGPDTDLLRLLAGVHLHQDPRPAPAAVGFPGEHGGEARPVQGLDDVEDLDRLPDLVGLQRADQAKLPAQAPVSPAFQGLLNPILPENPLATGDNGLDSRPGLLFGDRGQGYGRRVPTNLARGRSDAREDCSAAAGGVGVGGVH